MVKLGFIGEGATEKNILESSNFRLLLDELQLDYIEDVIDAGGVSKLIPDKLPDLVKILEDKDATQIIILTDLDNLPSISAAKERVQLSEEHIVIIAVKEVEAWFLADTIAISKCLKQDNYFCEFPESINAPFSFIKEKAKEFNRGRGFRKKIILCEKMLNNGFSVQNAAKHPHCPSAASFVKQLENLRNV